MGRVKTKRGRRHPIEPPRLKVAVVTSPASSESNVNLARDVQLAKAAVLYADEVELISPGTEIIASLVQLAVAGPDAVVELLSALDESTLSYLNGGREVPESVIENFRLLMAMDDELLETLGSLTGTDATELKALAGDARTQVDGMATQLQETAQRMFKDSGASGVRRHPRKGRISHGHTRHIRREPFALNPTRRPVTAAALNESQEFVGSGRIGLPERLRLELSAGVPPLNG